METCHRPRRRRAGLKSLLLVAAPVIAFLALPAPPASAGSNHTVTYSASVDIKDDDVGQDDWCRGVPYGGTEAMQHTESFDSFLFIDDYRCDEVRIMVWIDGDLMPDHRLCNIHVQVTLYEGTSNQDYVTDEDGQVEWNGGMNFCLGNGGSLRWDVIRVDNTAENAPDHGWVRNLTITHRF